MRATLAGLVALALGGGVVVLWQRAEIAGLRKDVASLREGQARLVGLLAERPDEVAPAASREGSAAPATSPWRHYERRLILNQYRDVLAQMGLPLETQAQLQDLLEDRVETALDAEDAARREGFAEGSAEGARAVAAAIGEVDRDIAGLLGPAATERFDALAYGGPPEASVPQAAPVPVTVVVAPAAPAEAAEVPEAAAATALPYYYLLYPAVGYPVAGIPAHRPGLPVRHGSPRAGRTVTLGGTVRRQ